MTNFKEIEKIVLNFIETRMDKDEIKILRQRPGMLIDLIFFYVKKTTPKEENLK